MARAAIDPDFRRRLLLDARGAIADTFGVQVPASLRLKFVEKDTDVDLMFVLPDLISSDGRLRDDDLRTVIGGAACPWLLGDLDPAAVRTFCERDQ